MNDKNEDTLYTIPLSVLQDVDLNLNEMRLYCYLRHKINNSNCGYIVMSNEEIGTALQLHWRTIQRGLLKLDNKNMLARDSNGADRLLTM